MPLNIDQFTDNENDKDILNLLEEKGKNAKDFIFVSPCVFHMSILHRKSSFQVTGIRSSGVVKTCIILVLESHDNNEFPFEFLHPEENFDATLHENFNDLDKHLINDRTVLIETLKRTESGYSPPPPITFTSITHPPHFSI